MFSVLFRRCLKYLIPGADDFIPRLIIHQHTPCSPDQLFPMSTNSFDGLPYDVVGTIFGKLPIGDRVRKRLVSKSWRDRLVRSDFPVKPEPPWLILPIDSYDQSEQLSTEMSFESMSEERIYRFELPVCSGSGGGGRYRWCCCGASSDRGGWLLLAGRKAGDDLSSTTMILWDPISGTTKGLPALSTLPFFGELVGDCEKIGLENISTSEVIARAQVFSVGSCVVVAVVFVTNLDCVIKPHRLALCSPEDQSWRFVLYGHDDHYDDILFRNGKLYTVSAKKQSKSADQTMTWLTWSGPVAGRTRNCMVRLSCCDVEVIMLDLAYENQPHAGEYDDDHAGSRTLIERWNVVEHLVGSSTTGELLVVSAFFDSYSYDSGGCGPFASHAFSQTRGFEVHGLDVNDVNGLCCLERLRNVGNQCIFVGATGSTSVESGVDCNKIHFATNDAAGAHWINADDSDDDEQDHIEVDADDDLVGCALEELLVVHEQGVFDVPRDKIERKCWTNLSKQSGSCVGWFTPKLPT